MRGVIGKSCVMTKMLARERGLESMHSDFVLVDWFGMLVLRWHIAWLVLQRMAVFWS